jgi:hypothetical protein
VKISLAVGLTIVTLGASTLVEVDPGTTVHGGAVPPVPVELGEGLAEALADGLALAEAEAEGLAEALADADAEALAEGEADAEALGLGLGVPPVLLEHATPLRVNAVGVSMVPLRLKLAPRPVEAPVARVPFQLRLATETDLPLCVQVPSQPLESVSAPAYAYARVQLVIAGPSFVMLICAWKPLPQLEVTL